MSEDLVMKLYDIMKDYQELGEMIPGDHPGSRMITLVNEKFAKTFYQDIAQHLNPDTNTATLMN
jgi:hypothetical protein